MRRSLLAIVGLLFALPSLAATLWVTEFPGAPPQSVYYQAVRYPALASTAVAIGGSSTQSAVFQDLTGIVRVTCDIACLVDIGVNPTAVAGSLRIPAGGVEYFVVPNGYRLAVLIAP